MTAAFRRANRRTFASLRRHRNYRLFFAGQIVSVSGTWMQNIAAAWLVLQLTHSPVAVGVLALCQFLPFTVFGLFAGVLVDRLDARRTVMGTQAAALVLAAILAGLTLAGHVTALDVYLLTALRGVVLVLDAPARQALTFEMVGAEELPNAVALNSSLFNAARVVGPAVGGALVATVGVGACFSLNAVSYIAVLAGLAAMRRSELYPVERPDRPPRFLRGNGRGARTRPPDACDAPRAHDRVRGQHALVQLQRPPARPRRPDAGVRRRRLRDRDRGVRGRRARRRTARRLAGPCELDRAAGRRHGVRRRADGSRSRAQHNGCRGPPLRRRRLLHALDIGGERDRPALDSRTRSAGA